MSREARLHKTGFLARPPPNQQSPGEQARSWLGQAGARLWVFAVEQRLLRLHVSGRHHVALKLELALYGKVQLSDCTCLNILPPSCHAQAEPASQGYCEGLCTEFLANAGLPLGSFPLSQARAWSAIPGGRTSPVRSRTGRVLWDARRMAAAATAPAGGLARWLFTAQCTTMTRPVRRRSPVTSPPDAVLCTSVSAWADLV